MDKLRDITFIISGESYSIMNAEGQPNLSVNYGSENLRFNANHGTGFTDEMRMIIACD